MPKIKLIITGILLVAGLLAAFLLGSISIISSVIANDSENNYNSGVIGTGEYTLTPQVNQYRALVYNELKKKGREEFVDVVLAIIQRESGGRGNDPMQASESKCGYIGCITSPEESIRYGVSYFIKLVDESRDDLKIALQSYNFGTGFIDYVRKNGGEYSYRIAVSYSQMMYEKLQHTGIYRCHSPEAIELNACYGDILYVEEVLKYVPAPRMLASGLMSPLSNDYRINSPYGWRNIGAGLEHHNGIDLSCSIQDSVHAVSSGTVKIAGKYSGAISYGNFVTIEHNSTLYTTYAHLSIVDVKPGEKVSAGEKLGYCGSTGRVTGPHLHFEIKTKMWSGYKDPEPYLEEIEDEDD